MPTTILALKLFLLLLPGFLSVKVSQRLTLYEEKSVFQHVIDALVFSLIIAAVYLGAAGLFPDKLVPLDRITIEEGDISFGGFDKFSLSALIMIAFIVGGVHGFIAEKGWVKKRLTAWHITRRTGRLNVWSDVFYNHVDSWLRVYMEDGVVIEGWCEYFSDSAQDFELFLKEVIIYRDGESDEELYKNTRRNILLNNRESIKMIEFLEQGEGKEESEDG